MKVLDHLSEQTTNLSCNQLDSYKIQTKNVGNEKSKNKSLKFND